jgi:hypothetical protein
MKSYTTLRNLGASWTGVATTDTTTMALLDQHLNDSIRTIATMRGGKWSWLETTENVATVAGQGYVTVPQRIRKLTSVLFSGTNIYYPVTPVFDPNQWNTIIASRLASSDVPLFVYVADRTVNIAPTPASTANTVIMRGRLNLRDLSIADYTTGKILTATNGSTAIVGDTTPTVWTAAMAGRYIRITDGNADNNGDHFWYKIASVTDGTHLTLSTPYEGTSISAGAASYTIGEMSPIPESYDVAPVYRAVALYWSFKENETLAEHYWRLYDGGKEAGFSEEIGGLIGQMLEEAAETIEGAYIPPGMMRMIDPNVPPQNLSGF